MFDKIFQYAGPHKKGMIRATILVLFSVISGVIPFFIAYKIIAPLIIGESLSVSYVSNRVFMILIFLILQALLYGWGLSISHKAAYGTLNCLRVSLQEKLETLPLGVIQEKGTGILKKLFVDDVDGLELLLAHTLPEGIANLMVPVVVYIMMFVVDWKLAFMSLASVPLSIIAMKTMYSIGMKNMGSYYQAGQIMNNTIIEYINGMEVIKIFNKAGESYERFENDVKNYRDLTLEWYKACWPWMAIYNSLLPCTIILTLPLGAWFVLRGYSTLPDLILILCLSLSIGMPLLKALGFLPTMPQINYKIMAIEGILQSEPLKHTNSKFVGNDYKIEYKNVTFGYDEKDVISNVSFVIQPNDTVALVGESGSGKSTLAKLLVHYYDIKKGQILIGGQDIRDMSLISLNNMISYVSQDLYLFNTSILENIRLGNPKASDKEVIAAAKKAECIEFINGLPDGIHTMAGERGSALSGGQRQRISLARAILKDAPIIVLDEATAFIDPENEDKIQRAISKLVQNKTLLVIAHKLNSIKDADMICVLNKGQLESKGKHFELMKNSPSYQKLWNAQNKSSKWKMQVLGEMR